MTSNTELSCGCGQFHIEVERAPIISTECHCSSCRAAGVRLQALPAVPPFVEANGGTRFVLYRKDRIRFVKGGDLLREFRLVPGAKNRRVVAACCNTPVFLEFESGHWLSLYKCLWRDGALPPVDLRTMTSDLPDASTLSADIPSGTRQTMSFYAKLLAAWIAMGFKSPKIAVNGQISA